MAVFLVFVPSPVFLVKRDWNNAITAFYILFFLLKTLSMHNKMDKKIIFLTSKEGRITTFCSSPAREEVPPQIKHKCLIQKSHLLKETRSENKM